MAKVNKFVFWIPRVLAILFILFLALFSLDVITPESKFWEIIAGLLMHNIPVFILIIIILAISLKHELVGAIAFMLAGLLYITQLIISALRTGQFEGYILSYSLIIAGPALIVGILFLIGWIQKNKTTRKKK